MSRLVAALLLVEACARPLPSPSPPSSPSASLPSSPRSVSQPSLVAPTGVLRRGTRFTARLTDSIATTAVPAPGRQAELTRAGQPYHALSLTPIVDGAGRVRVAPGALVEGHITTLARGRGVGPPRVELDVERLCARPVAARVVAVPVEALARQQRDHALAGATFAWLFLGTISFGMPGFMLGSTVGSVGGSVEAARATVTEAWVAAGSVVTVELAAPVVLGQRC